MGTWTYIAQDHCLAGKIHLPKLASEQLDSMQLRNRQPFFSPFFTIFGFFFLNCIITCMRLLSYLVSCIRMCHHLCSGVILQAKSHLWLHRSGNTTGKTVMHHKPHCTQVCMMNWFRGGAFSEDYQFIKHYKYHMYKNSAPLERNWNFNDWCSFPPPSQIVSSGIATTNHRFDAAECFDFVQDTPAPNSFTS